MQCPRSIRLVQAVPAVVRPDAAHVFVDDVANGVDVQATLPLALLQVRQQHRVEEEDIVDVGKDDAGRLLREDLLHRAEEDLQSGAISIRAPPMNCKSFSDSLQSQVAGSARTSARWRSTRSTPPAVSARDRAGLPAQKGRRD